MSLRLLHSWTAFVIHSFYVADRCRHTRTHIHARMRIRNDTQSKRDSRVNEKVNNRCVFAQSHLRPRSAEAIRDTLGHWELQLRGNVELVLRDGIFRIVNRSENRRKSQRIRRRECRNWEINAIAANSCKGEWIMADRSYEWAKTTGKMYHELCSGLARLWKCMMKFLEEIIE